MADKKASIRLDLKADGFKRTLQGVSKDVQAAGKKMGPAIGDAMDAGAKKGFDAVKGMFNGIKSLAGQAAALLGGLSFGALIKQSFDAQKGFRQLANNVRAAGGEVTNWQQLQRQVADVAKQTKVDVDQLGLGLRATFRETGDIKAAQRSLEAVGVVSEEFGASIETTGKLAGILQQKFGLSADQVGDGLLQMVAAANRGGASIEDLGDDFAEIGGKAKTLGLTGPEGIKKMAGFLNLAKQETGNFSQAMTALPQVFDQIIERTSKGFVESGGKVPMKIQAVDDAGRPRDPFDIIADIIAKTKGDAAKLGEFGFGGEGLQTLLAISKKFQRDLDDTGGDVEAARSNLQTALNSAAGSAQSFSDLLGKRAKEKDPSKDLNDALNRLKEAFRSPQMVSAITTLAEKLPALAEAASKALEFIMDNPVSSAGVLVGAKAGTGFAGGAISSVLGTAFSSGGNAAGKAVEAGMVRGGVAASAKLGLAFTAAAISIAAAVEQGIKLSKETNERTTDIKNEREQMLRNARRQGQNYVVRQRGAADWAATKPSDVFREGAPGMFDKEEVVVPTAGGGTKAYRKSYFEANKNKILKESAPVDVPTQYGKAPTIPSIYERQRREQADEAAAAAKRRAALGQKGPILRGELMGAVSERLGRGLSGREEMIAGSQLFEREQRGVGADQTLGQFAETVVAAIKADKGAADKAMGAVAKQLGGELRVRVVNAAEIKGTPTGATPVP